MRFFQSICASIGVAFVMAPALTAVPDRPRPEVPLPEIRIDPVAVKILQAGFAGTKWETEIEQSAFKFIVGEARDGNGVAIAANDVTFSSTTRVYARIVGIAIEYGNAKPGTMVHEPQPAFLVFDRPIGSLRDLARAKLREIDWLNGSRRSFAPNR
jgi:hypothetical protein